MVIDMTDAEIIKTLEECLQKCQTIKYGARKSVFVQSDLLQNALDIINRQKAESDRLEDMLDSAVTSEANAHYCYKDSRAEAIKEFAERLKEKAERYDDEEFYVNDADIDNLVKEMAGADNG